jgi:protein SCO1/2
MLVAGCGRADRTVPRFHGVDITGADYARRLELPDAEGKPRSLAEFKGKATLVFFGYVQCPDVCPTTLAELAEVKRSLGADGERVQGVFVTLDPERDTPEVLKKYVTAFHPSFVALRGTPEQTRAAAKEFKVFFAKVPGKGEGRRPQGAARERRWLVFSQRLAHLLHRGHFDLPDAFRADAVVGSQFVQRLAA